MFILILPADLKHLTVQFQKFSIIVKSLFELRADNGQYNVQSARQVLEESWIKFSSKVVRAEEGYDNEMNEDTELEAEVIPIG